MGQDGKLLGARMPPSCMSKCCFPACAISGYITGDPTDGSLEGPALIACLLNFFCICVGSIYALAVWKPDPEKIKGDGTMRTLNNRCMAVCCLGAPCAIAFWQSGDGCTSCCEGDAGMACILNVVGNLFGIPHVGDFFACCCWTPNPTMFKRTPEMHGGRLPKAGEAVGAAAAAVGAVIAGAVAQAVPVAQAVAVAAPANNEAK